MDFIDKTEGRFGKYAIQGLPQKLATIQVVYFVILMIKQLQGFQFYDVVKSISKFNIPGTTILSDIYFTIATPAATPGPFMNYFWMYFGTYLFVLYGNSLENLWGTYKFNVYILLNIVFSVIVSQIIFVITKEQVSVGFLSFLNVAVLLAAATHFPKFELLIYFILPVPLWIIGLLSAGYIFYWIFTFPAVLFKVYIFASAFGTYLFFHLKHFKDYQVQKTKTALYEKKVEADSKKPFHQCVICNKTEHDDKNLEFRIGDDGEEYCNEHINQAG